MKLVIDTNLLISGSLWKGSPAHLLDLTLQAPNQLLLSQPLLAELAQTLKRPKFVKRLLASGLSAEEIVVKFRNASREIVAGPVVAPAHLRDPDDLHVLACGLIGQADFIVTGDKDLLVLGSFEGIPILDINEALRRLAS